MRKSVCFFLHAISDSYPRMLLKQTNFLGRSIRTSPFVCLCCIGSDVMCVWSCVAASFPYILYIQIYIMNCWIALRTFIPSPVYSCVLIYQMEYWTEDINGPVLAISISILEVLAMSLRKRSPEIGHGPSNGLLTIRSTLICLFCKSWRRTIRTILRITCGWAMSLSNIYCKWWHP